MVYQCSDQLNGTAAHDAVDNHHYSSKRNIITSLDVFSEKYKLIGKIDLYDEDKRLLTERKKMIKTIYDGYIFQLYAQYFCMTEMGFVVEKMELYSMDDHKRYDIKLPEDNPEMTRKFEKTIGDIGTFILDDFIQENPQKCNRCIYEPSCDRSVGTEG